MLFIIEVFYLLRLLWNETLMTAYALFYRSHSDMLCTMSLASATIYMYIDLSGEYWLASAFMWLLPSLHVVIACRYLAWSVQRMLKVNTFVSSKNISRYNEWPKDKLDELRWCQLEQQNSNKGLITHTVRKNWSYALSTMADRLATSWIMDRCKKLAGLSTNWCIQFLLHFTEAWYYRNITNACKLTLCA